MESKDPLLGFEGMWVRIAMLYSQAGMVDNALNVFDEMLERKRWDFWEKSLCGVVPVLVGNGVFSERLDKVLEFVHIMICWSILRYISIWLRRVNLMVH